jgi:hypothetical protein
VAPPFNADLPETGPKAVYERLTSARSSAISAAREKAANRRQVQDLNVGEPRLSVDLSP